MGVKKETSNFQLLFHVTNPVFNPLLFYGASQIVRGTYTSKSDEAELHCRIGLSEICLGGILSPVGLFLLECEEEYFRHCVVTGAP